MTRILSTHKIGDTHEVVLSARDTGYVVQHGQVAQRISSKCEAFREYVKCVIHAKECGRIINIKV